jgi:hypothetical protein
MQVSQMANVRTGRLFEAHGCSRRGCRCGHETGTKSRAFEVLVFKGP